jgi:hypothetical protein
VTRALLLASAVTLVAGCGGGSTAAQTTTDARFHYPETVTKNYMRSCLSSPKTTRAYCTCTLDKLAENVSTKDFERIGLSGGKIPPRIRTIITVAARDCRDKL